MTMGTTELKTPGVTSSATAPGEMLPNGPGAAAILSAGIGSAGPMSDADEVACALLETPTENADAKKARATYLLGRRSIRP